MKELSNRVKSVEEQVKEIVAENEKLQENMEQIAEKTENLEENIGMIDVYKAILKNSEDNRMIQQETDRFLKRILILLIVLVIVFAASLAITHIEFNKYQKNSISKAELIDYLKD
jgi:predicted nuclease with TOPRIM domain